MKTLTNGEKTLKLRRLYTYASKFALIVHFLKTSLGIGNLWDHLKCVMSHTCIESRFSTKHCQLR